MGCVYLVTNILNGDRYVGCSRYTAQRRWSEHVARAHRGKTHFARAIVKYGADNFVLSVLDDDIEFLQALALEKIRIKELSPRYNLTAGGEGVVGWTPSPETRKLWSEQRKGRKLSSEHAEKCRTALRSAKARENFLAAIARPEFKQKQSERGKMRVFSQEHIEKLKSNALKGPKSAHHKESIRNALRASDRSRLYVISRMKAVVCLTTGIIYNGAMSAPIDNGLSYQTVQKRCQRSSDARINQITELRFAFLHPSHSHLLVPGTVIKDARKIDQRG
jgi:group I intron endonuclease